jgi:hypothetical protein
MEISKFFRNFRMDVAEIPASIKMPWNVFPI